MTKRQVFYSFHFKNDSWRAGQVRNIGVVEGNTPVSSNDWEEVKRKGDDSIKRWIDTHGKSSVSCPLKPSDSAPLKHSTMPP